MKPEKFKKRRNLKEFGRTDDVHSTRVARFVIFGKQFSVRIPVVKKFEEAFRQVRINKTLRHLEAY